MENKDILEKALIEYEKAMKNKKKAEKLREKALAKVETAKAKRKAKLANEGRSEEGKSEEVD